jgi:hypothetical protein
MRLKWFPWRFLIKWIARSHGFLDPVAILSRLHRFAQPSEVAEPLELLRSGMLFHARGLINTRAIQHNLDWVWPFWVERQFNPNDDAFIPRAFSITHVNLTHRNWTAVGIPGYDELSVVDPRGLVMPFWDSWSLDGWVVAEDGRMLFPSRLESVEQRFCLDDGVAVETAATRQKLSLTSRVDMVFGQRGSVCRIRVRACADSDAWGVIALRPYNPEGVSFIQNISMAGDRSAFIIDNRHRIEFNVPPERYQLSYYQKGDVASHLFQSKTEERVDCDVGLATAAALFRLQPGRDREIVVSVPIAGTEERPAQRNGTIKERWGEAFEKRSVLQVPDQQARFLYEAAMHSIILHTPGDVYPGPYTYKRFWFRDAAFIIHALLCTGLSDRAERLLDRFPQRQQKSGYFHAQEGEWDSNGQVLWLMHRFCRLTGRPPKEDWLSAIRRAGAWIVRKRLPDHLDAPHAGLLPAGFSAEHLGPNDYYYWDDFWSIAGLQGAADLLEGSTKPNDSRTAGNFRREASNLLKAIERSLAVTADRTTHPEIPASPYRRMDAGAVGSLAAGYPLQLWRSDDPRLLGTVDLLLKKYLVHGGFFQDMVHSGINAYLTLHLAQVLLRAGDPRCFELIDAVKKCASPTGQWPEAIHPRTGGGCMGDGQHMWASAEWVLIMRNSFVREERDRLVLASGIPRSWLKPNEVLSWGAAPTPYGDLSVVIEPTTDHIAVSWEGRWRDKPPLIEVRLPGYRSVTCGSKEQGVIIKGEKSA